MSEELDIEMSPQVMGAVSKQAGVMDDVMQARLKRIEREQYKALLANPALLVEGYQKLLRVIAYAYQIAGAHDCPEHILDVLADPEGATDEQVEAMLPYHVSGPELSPQFTEQLKVEIRHNCVWVVRGVQSFMLGFDADTEEELQWYAEQLRKVLQVGI